MTRAAVLPVQRPEGIRRLVGRNLTLAVLTRPVPRQALLGASRGDLPPDGEQPQRIGGTAATAPFAPSSVESDYLQVKAYQGQGQGQGQSRVSIRIVRSVCIKCTGSS